MLWISGIRFEHPIGKSDYIVLAFNLVVILVIVLKIALLQNPCGIKLTLSYWTLSTTLLIGA